jgi:hypothetical protein
MGFGSNKLAWGNTGRWDHGIMNWVSLFRAWLGFWMGFPKHFMTVFFSLLMIIKILGQVKNEFMK